ncbi:lipoprotein [Sulfurimonas sp.]|nr:lipoprotein [Sulfurimonas sp.]MCK9473673.1 lipoprotein [Sulfurimonas sp.]
MMKKIIFLISTVLVFTGCSFMPYKENFSCSGDVNAGSCGMVRDNYNR